MTPQPPNPRSIFGRAVEIDSADERKSYLDDACAGAPEVRDRVEALLRAHEAAGGFLQPAAAGPSETASYIPSPELPQKIGPYKLLEKIGEGGMGEVWVADQMEPIKRRVALKLIKPGMDSRGVLARFEAERQALAVMDHPNIAKVLDAGTAPDGRPYFVMELVKGTPITEFCDIRKLPPKERLKLFVPVCQAIQHAHMKGIIHRDIKPSNVLVELYDDQAVAKVIDFGVAKAVGQQLTEKTIYTGFGALVGTPTYMAPEQAMFNALDVDTRADVYALGVLLYELLAGSPPIEKERLNKAALDEVLRIVREEEPPRPSQRVSTSQAKATIAATRGSEPAKLSALMKGELDWIVMKALEKDRTRRYETANGFALDVNRYLSGEPVQAVPPRLGYRLRKFTRRNRTTIAVAALVSVTLLVGVSGTAWQAAERRRDRDVAAARSQQLVESALGQAEAALRSEKLAEVDAALAVAERGLGQAAAPDLQDRIAAVKKDRAMVARLNDAFEETRGVAVPLGDHRPELNSRRGSIYRAAFEGYGLAIGVESPAETRHKLQRSGIPNTLLTGLGDWFFLDPRQAGLREVLDLADPDQFRSTVRSAVAADDLDGLRTLATGMRGADLPPGFAVALGSLINDERGLRLMQSAWLAHPDYYPLARQIGSYLCNHPHGDIEAGYWFRIAIALRPKSPASYVNYTFSQLLGPEYQGAEAAIRTAMRLGLDDSEIHTLLGYFLFKQAKYADAKQAFQVARKRDPGFHPAYVGLLMVVRVEQDWNTLACMLEESKSTRTSNPEPRQSYLHPFMNGVETSGSGFILRDLLQAGRPGLASRFEVHSGCSNNYPYDAACAAVQAGTGRGSDAPPENERPTLRRKALGWLSENLRHWNQLAADPAADRKRTHREMNDWLTTEYLKPVRDETEIAKLPSEEQEAWRALWTEVRSLHARTRPPEIAPPPRELKK